MLFPTVTFALFFALVLPLSWWLRPTPQRTGIGAWCVAISAASFCFYGWHLWRFMALLAVCVVVNWWFGVQIGAGKRSVQQTARHADRAAVWVRIGVVANLALLAWFKYATFASSSLINGLSDLGISVSIPLVRVALPVGISFFTFHAISYLVDIGRGQLEPVGLAEFAAYMSFFPHLVAGPIVRGSELLPQFRQVRSAEEVDIVGAGRLILIGLTKKVVISSYLSAALVDDVFAQPSQHSRIAVLLGIYGYAAQIYCDFSGYTDIAIGIAGLLGFSFPNNFDAPYTAASLQDFWRRWHMTLSRWLRDYLYIPLGGNRGSTLRTYRNLMLTMVLGGLWHGASWTFVVWGTLHGVGLAAERIWQGRRGAHAARLSERPARRWLGRLFTFHFVCVAWVFFRAESFGSARAVLGRIFSGGFGPVGVHPAYVLALGVGLGAQFIDPSVIRKAEVRLRTAHPAVLVLGASVALMVISALGPEGVAPFIYFRF